MALLTDKDFNNGSAMDSGGATGSMQVSLQSNAKQKYQLKSSIKQAKWLRRRKARGTDRENFGEVIASCIGREMLPADGVDLVPEVSLVHDTRSNTIAVASKYLDGVQGTLDDFAAKQNVEFGKHTRVTFKETTAPGELSLAGDDKKLLRADLANAIAVSVIIGDHDVNPGNMLHVKDKQGRDRIARIDFGHAFNDLLNAPKVFGGKVVNKENTVMDFFNRETVGHLKPKNRVTKLWRDYDGIIPSEELAEALEKMAAKQTKVAHGIVKAASQFADMAAEDPKLASHIKKSLAAISNNVTGEALDISQSVDKCIVKAFENLHNFSVKQCEQMKDVAQVMKLQVEIEKGIKRGGQNVEVLVSMQRRLEGKPGIEKDGQIQWMKNSRGTKAFKGTIREYIAHRKEQMRTQKVVKEQVKGNEVPISKKTNIVKRVAKTMVNGMRKAFKGMSKGTKFVVRGVSKARSKDQGIGM